MKGNSGAHKNFTQEMSKKTVTNRACKHFYSTSDDSDILIESINRTAAYNKEDIIESTAQEVSQDIEENTCSEVIDVELEDIKKNNVPY